MTDNSDRLQEQGMRSLRRLQEQGLSMARTLRPESNPLEDLGYRSCILREATHNESKAWRRLRACNLSLPFFSFPAFFPLPGGPAPCVRPLLSRT